MKKVLLGITTLLVCMFVFSNFAGAACNLEGIYDNYQAVYNPVNDAWNTGSMADERVVLTKKTSSGSGSYSEYYYADGNLAVALSSNYEFVKDGKLIAVDNAGLKYYKVVYKDSKFEQVPLCNDELQKLFPKAEIVKISQFTNNKIKIKKPYRQDKIVLLVNDTDKDFYKYSYEPSDVQKSDIKGLIKLTKRGKIEFSHYGDNEDKLIINVR